MNLMDKFSAVEIKADNRISEGDKAFCLRHQAAFDKAGPALQKIADLLIAAQQEQREALQPKEDAPYREYLTCDGFSCDEDSVYKAMKRRNKTFIRAIVDYFRHKYKVELDAKEIVDHLIPASPKEPQLPRGGYRDMSDAEIDAFKERLSVYKAEKEKYEQSMRTLPLRYEQVVDEIFVQLGGFSFQERAMNEFLGKCWDASHSYRGDKENFEIKNDTLRLTNNYWCRCRDDSWRDYPEWEPTDNLKVILDALVHYDIGQLERGAEWFPELFRYSTEKNNFPINNLWKVKNIKLFKNGRVDIKFASSANVQEFVEQYLRKRIGGMSND